MSNFTKTEQLGLLKRGLERRIKGENSYIGEMQKNIDIIEEKRKEYVERIEKYADDEVVVQILKAQLSEFDRQYTGTKQNYKLTIQEVLESEPKVKRMLKLLKDNKQTNELFFLTLELFMKAAFTDWNEMEQNVAKSTLDKNQKEKPDGKVQ